MSISRYSQRTLLTGTPCACDGEPSDREASPAIRFSLLAALAAKLLVVELLDGLDRRLELLLVGDLLERLLEERQRQLAAASLVPLRLGAMTSDEWRGTSPPAPRPTTGLAH